MTNDTVRILANCLDVIEQRGATLEECVAPYPDQRGPLIELLSAAQALRAAPAVTPSLDFRIDARQRLIAHLPSRRSRRAVMVNVLSAWRHRLVASKVLLLRLTVILLVGVVIGSSVVAASAQSLPNDVLYPVKRTMEQARLVFAPDSTSSGDLRLTFAVERLAEVQRLIDRDRGAEAVIAIDDFSDQMESAVSITQSMPDTTERAILIKRVNESIQSSDVVLSRAQERLPEAAQVAVKRARAVLAERPSDPRGTQPLVLPPVPTVVIPDPTATRHSTPASSRTLPSVTRGTPRWMPTPVEHHPVNPPALQPTSLPTRQPTIQPTHRTQRRTLVPPTTHAQLPPSVHPTRLPPAFPTVMPPLQPTFESPRFPTPMPHFIWPGPGGRH
jgi:hypothetical protein